MQVFDSVKFLLPSDLLPLPLAEGYRVAAATFDLATATLDEAPVLIGSVTT